MTHHNNKVHGNLGLEYSSESTGSSQTMMILAIMHPLTCRMDKVATLFCRITQHTDHSTKMVTLGIMMLSALLKTSKSLDDIVSMKCPSVDA